METTLVKHYKLPVTAPLYAWSAMGWETSYNMDGTPCEIKRRSFASNEDEQVLGIAIAKGLDGIEALAFCVEELTRRHEEKTRSTAIARQAEAIDKLAGSLRTESDQAVLGKIINQLSESTQWAVRSQLKGKGILPS
jgi:hypothetical protein